MKQWFSSKAVPKPFNKTWLMILASNPASSGTKNKVDANQKLAELFRKKDNILYDENEWKNKLKTIEKSLDQKTKDFNSSRPSHGDYPIGDYYKKVEERHKKDIEAVNRNLEKAKVAYTGTVNAIIALIRPPSPGGVQSKAREDSFKFEHDPVQGAKLIALQGRVSQLETLLKEEGAKLKTLSTEQDAKYEELLKAALKIQQEEQEARFLDLLKSQEARQEERFKVLIQQQEALQDERYRALEKKLASSFQESHTQPRNGEIEVLMQANENLENKLSAQKQDATQQVSELNQKLHDASESIEQLRSSLQTVEGNIGRHGAMLHDHEHHIAQVDFDNLDQIAEGWALEFPALKDAAATHTAEIKSLKGEMEPLKSMKIDFKTEFNKLKSAQDQMISLLGGELDAQKSSLDALAKESKSNSTRFKALEDDLEKVAIPAQTPVVPAVPNEDSPSASIKAELGLIKSEVDDLKEVNEKRYDSLMHIITSMQSQYDNINTMELANRIAGVMETLYPNTRQLSQDLEFLKSQMSESRSRLGGVEERMGGNEVKLVELFRDLGDMIAREGLGRSYVEDSRPSKRPRMESANGHHPVENGRHRS